MVAAVDDEVGHVGAVVGVQVREGDGVELPRVEVALQRSEGAVAQVEQQPGAAGRDEVARGGRRSAPGPLPEQPRTVRRTEER